jgi:hypothetical protein
VFIAFFNGLLVLVAIFQLCIYRDMHNTTKTELRAYTALEIYDFPKTLIADRPVYFRFRLTNHGPTPATNLGFRAKIWIFPKPIPEAGALPKIEGDWNEDRLTVFPYREGTITEMGCNLGDSFNEGQLALLSLGSSNLVLGLEIKYRDVFTKWHETREYFAFIGQGGGRNTFTIPGGSRAT